MNFYKKAYRIIGIVVLVLGICIIPFINFFIKNPPNIPENLKLIYILFLSNTSLSYFFAYKKSIITANQKEYIISRFDILFYFIKSILQIVFLLTTHMYITFLIIQIACTLLENIALSVKANKMYSYLNNKNYNTISKDEKGLIKDNVKSLVVYKFGSVILNGTDNIIISKMIGVVAVGLYSNYLLIVQAISNMASNAISAFTASVGNLNATAEKKEKGKVFYELLLVCTWVFGFCSIMLLILLNDFIKLWIGERYIFEFITVFAIVLHFFVQGIQAPGYIYRTTLGLFTKGKKAPLIAAIINIVLSIVLGTICGTTGILLATSISRLITTTWYDPYIVHKTEFKTSFLKFIKKYSLYFLITIINFTCCYFATEMFDNGICGFILKGIIATIISNLIFFLFFMKTKEFSSIKARIKNMRRKRNELSNNEN